MDSTEGLLGDQVVEIQGRPYCPLDKEWSKYIGWPSSVKVIILNHQLYFDLPPNPNNDFMHLYVDIPGMYPVTPKFMQIPQNIIKICLNSCVESNLLFEKLNGVVQIANPHYKFMEYFLDELPDLVESLEGLRARRALDLLHPIAYKVDLFRVIALFHYGGFYCDSKVVPIFPLDRFLPTNGSFLAKDRGNWGFWNGVLATPRHDPLMRRVIDQIILNVETRFYGDDPLFISGPQLIKQVLNELPAGDRAICHVDAFADDQLIFVRQLSDESIPLFVLHNLVYRNMCSQSSVCYYWTLWHMRAVYGEKVCHNNGISCECS